MYWQNTDTLFKNEASSAQPRENEGKKPQPRWGQACLTAHNKLYIIGGYEGQYLGDVWQYDFTTLSFTELKIIGDNTNALSRSNHTAVFYPKHNSIYVFGGGQSQRQRFNDTLKLELAPLSNDNVNSDNAKLSKVTYSNPNQIPDARTYHASSLVNSFMVVIGGEANSDLKDFWALNLDTMTWLKPNIEGFSTYTAKRFHTASTLGDSKIVTFGGCHSEYVHMNEMHIFDMTDYLRNYQSIPSTPIMCNKVNVTEGVPSTRWGHSAAIYKDKLYILGGRNEHDIIDLHEFDPSTEKWRPIQINGQMPKARRRHSSLFVSGSLIMFGGFDGNFFNDLNILDFTKTQKTIIQIQPSTIEQEYASLVNNIENSDIQFGIGPEPQSVVYAHKALILFRTIEREIQQEQYHDLSLSDIMAQRRAPKFLSDVYYAKPGSRINLPEQIERNSFLKFLEFLYCDNFLTPMTTFQVKEVAEIAKTLQLVNLSNLLKRNVEAAYCKIQEKVMTEFQSKNPTEALNLTRPQQKMLKQKCEQLEATLKFDFSSFEEFQIQSPEDNKDRQQFKAASLMNQCKNLDEFYDIIFRVGDTLIKANSTVLKVRSKYFESMLSTKYQFRESSMQNREQINVEGVPKSYFTNIIQYVYSDHFYIQRQEVDFFVKLMIYADYFMLNRLVDICSSYLKGFVNVKNVIKILLVAHAHNAEQLERFCINFISKNEEEVMKSRAWRYLNNKAQESLLQTFKEKIRDEKEDSYVQICIQNYINKHFPTDIEQNKYLPKKQSKRPSLNSIGNMEEELDLEDMLTTSTYIYLEDHQKFETYQEILAKPMSAFKTKGKSILNDIGEEEKTCLNSRCKEDKENVSLYSNINDIRVKHKLHLGYNMKNKGSILNNKKPVLQKKRDGKRAPLQQIDDEDQENIKPKRNNENVIDQEGQAQTPMQSQQTNNCNIFQRI